MKTLTEHLLPHAADMDTYFRRGAERAKRHEYVLAQKLFNSYREKRGFAGDYNAPLLTPPSANLKLKKGVTPSYGLTLQHTTTRVKRGLVVNACPNAGDCQKVCVLDDGHGMHDSVQEARRAKVDFLCEQPRAFALKLGWELKAACVKHGRAWKGSGVIPTPILFRPNVNSDVRWDLLIPSLFSGDDAIFGRGWSPASYGYTKDPFVLDTDGWITPHYRLAYSWNENSDPEAVITFLERGGSVAVVTDRKKGAPIPERYLFGIYGAIGRGVDADKTDEWMFQRGVIGDLSAKGRARRLIGKSGFVVTTGEAA